MAFIVGSPYSGKHIKKTEFRAKDIMQMLKIDRSRYNYLATKMGIEPEKREVVGRGSYHIYSLKNAVQFAIAHHLGNIGLNASAVRFTLDHINQVDKKHGIGIFDPNIPYFLYKLEIYNEIYPPLLHFDGKPPQHIVEKLKRKVEDSSGISAVEPEFERDMEYAISDFNDRISYMPEGPEHDEGYGQTSVETYSAEEEFALSLYAYSVLNFEPIRSRVFRYATKGW